MKPRLTLLVATAIGCSVAGPARAQSINDARDLYAGAAYAEALEMIEAVEKASPDAPATREALQYRALCLLALSRPREAEQTVAALVAKEPTYSPDAVEAPPQLRELFRVVREQQLPALVREKYAAARRSYAADRPAEAAAAFEAVLTLLDAPEVQSALGTEAVADMRTLATGFRDLAKSPAAAPATPPLPGASSPPTELRLARNPTAAPVVDAPPTAGPGADAPTFGADDADVVPPATVRQVVPPFRPEWKIAPTRGLLEVVINRDGKVETAAVRRAIHPIYDRMLLIEARTWRYEAATRNGAPVRYRKIIEVVIAADGR